MASIDDKEYQFLKKMKNSSYLKLNTDMMILLTNESERGAILIGTGKVEESLEKLVLTLLPSKSKSYTNRLLNYPEALSSFAAKIELCYAFRIINQRIYNSLNTIRKIRNIAAHSSDKFSLQNKDIELNAIYNFEENMPQLIHEMAYGKLIQWKKIQIRKVLEDNGHGDVFDEEWKKRFEDQDPLQDDAILEQLRMWKLGFGLSLMILKIEELCDKHEDHIRQHDTWLDIIQ
jgi:hypothetical protein